MIAQAAQATEAASGVDNTAAFLAAFVAAFVALAVAVIAAWTAQHRQRAQLQHDRELHAAQLRHDRELQDLAELREVLDEALALTYVVVDRFTDTLRAFVAWEASPTSDEAIKCSEDEHDRAEAELLRMAGMQARVALRLGQGDRAFASFAAFHLACWDVYRAMPHVFDNERPSTAVVGETIKGLRKLQSNLIEAAYLVVGSQVDGHARDGSE